MRPSDLRLALSGLALAALAGCASPAERPVPEVLGETVRTVQAADELRDLPIMFGDERLAVLQAIDPAAPNANYRYSLAKALLEAGRTRQAIELLGDEGELDVRSRSLLAQATLRLGEEANCLAEGHPAEACILPFRGPAVHQDAAPARRAAELFARLAASGPDTLGARWLANVAHLAAGDPAEAVPPDLLIPALFAAPSGGVPRLDNVAAARGVAEMALSGGVSIEDFDGDGDLDLLATSWSLTDPVRYFENDGRGAFTDRSHHAGLDGITGGLNTVHGDVDNDGDADVLVLRGAWLGPNGEWPNSLLRNDGDGRFTDVTHLAGLGSAHPTQTAAFADVDGDGWLDLFVGNESRPGGTERPSELFLNQGDGTFRDVAQEAGLDLMAFVKGSAWLDADGDGRPDLYASVMEAPNRLFLNRSDADGVRFVEAPGAAGAADHDDSFPVAPLDWDQDGDDDLLVFSYPRGSFAGTGGLTAHAAAEWLGRPLGMEPTRLFVNDGGAFRDATAEAGLERLSAAVMGVNVEDFDGDGAFDVYAGTGAPSFGALIPNRFLFGSAGGRFTDRTFASGTGHLQKGHAVAFGDLDGDLDPDLYVVAGGAFQADTSPNLLFDNPWQDRGWVVLRLDGRRANRSAIGARLAVTVRDADGARRTLHRAVGTGGSFGASSLQQEVGVGAGTVERVEVVWPGSGARERFEGVERGGRYRLVEGAGRAAPFELRRSAPAAPPAAHSHAAAHP